MLRRIPLPDEVAVTPIDDFFVADIAIAGGQVEAIFNDAVWVLDLEAETWTNRGDLPRTTVFLDPYRFTPDGRVVLLVEEGLTIVDVASGETETRTADFPDPYPVFAFVDDDVAIVSSETGDGVAITTFSLR